MNGNDTTYFNLVFYLFILFFYNAVTIRLSEKIILT